MKKSAAAKTRASAGRKKSKPTFKPGDQIVTNDAYGAVVGATHEGTLVQPQRWRDGLWLVRMHEPVHCLRPQLMHDSMFNIMDEEHVGTPTKETVKLSGFTWTKTTREQWVCEAISARIRRLDDHTYSVIRGPRYLGSEKTLPLAAERAKINDLSESNKRKPPWDYEAAPKRGSAAAPDAKARVQEEAKRERRAKANASDRNAELLQLLAKGCTREDILRVTGWKAVSVQAMAKGLGVGLRVDNSSKPYRYYSTKEET